jgi:uroporphyrinogen decarboxylase
MKQSSLFLDALRCKITARPPFWMMRQSGRYMPAYQKIRGVHKDFLTMIQKAEVTSELAMLPMRRFQLDAAILFSDILLVPYKMGLDLSFVAGHGPCFKEPIRNDAAVAQLKAIDVGHHLACVTESLHRLVSHPELDKPVIGFCGSPWTLAVYMVEGTISKQPHHIFQMLYQQPKTLNRLLTLLAQVHADYLKMQVAAGAKALMIFDSHAGLLASCDYALWSAHFIGTMIHQVKSVYPDIPVIVYSKGHAQAPLILAQETQVNCLGVDWTVNVAALRHQLSNKNIAIQGNLHPALLSMNDDESIRQAVKRQLKHHQEPGYILNLGHGIWPSAKLQAVDRLIQQLSGTQ